MAGRGSEASGASAHGMDFGAAPAPRVRAWEATVLLSLEKPLGFEAREEMQTQGSSLPFSKDRMPALQWQCLH